MKRVFILMMSICAVFMGCSKANEPKVMPVGVVTLTPKKTWS